MLREALMHLLFPHECLHCREAELPANRMLCESCLGLLERVDPKRRCRYCFCALEEAPRGVCQECRRRMPVFKGVAAVFEYEAAAATLVKQLKYGRGFELAKEIAAFMVVQFVKLDWPLPDLIVPVPLSFSHRFARGYNQSFLIALEMGRLLEKPAKELLKRRQYGLSQAQVGEKERRNLASDAFKWRARQDISDQVILVVDDVMTTRTTLNLCGSRLQEGFPNSLYALTFCSSG